MLPTARTWSFQTARQSREREIRRSLPGLDPLNASKDSPDKWPDLVEIVTKNVPVIQQRLGNYDLPLIWTIDFILDTDKVSGGDKYVLGEINASCVGFSTHLELSEDIADEIVRLMEAEAVVNPKWVAFST